MITALRAASKSQRLLPGHSLPTDPYPKDFSLAELCSKYPNHLFGTNLDPFLQHKWSPNRILSLMPLQDHIREGNRVTVLAIASRLKKAKAALRRSGELNELMSAPKTHAEGGADEIEKES